MEEVQERGRGKGAGAPGEYRRRIDDCAAHGRVGGVDDSEAVGVGAVEDTAVGHVVADTRDGLAGVGGVGDAPRQRRFAEEVVGEQPARIDAEGFAGVDCREERAALANQGGHVREVTDSAGVAGGHRQHQTIFEEVGAGVGEEVAGVAEGVHRLLGGGEEDIAGFAVHDAGQEGVRGVKLRVEADFGVVLAVARGDGPEGVRQGGVDEDGQLDIAEVAEDIRAVSAAPAAGRQRQKQTK